MRITGGFGGSVGYLLLWGSLCWQAVAVGDSWLLIPPKLYLVYFSSVLLARVYAMMILNMSMDTTGTLGGGGHVK